MNKVKMGVIGLGGRGRGMLGALCNCEEAEIIAVCDVYEDRQDQGVNIVKEKLGYTPIKTGDYREVLANPDIEAVMISTSWHTHTQIAVAAMKAGKKVALEVYGAYDVEECWELVRTYEETGVPFMFLENCCFDRFELLTTSLVRSGKFGKVVYCHGAYAHDLREEVLGGNVNRHYRLEEYTHRNCENYPTHELGPIAKILNINRGNKLLSLTSVATKSGIGLEDYVGRCAAKDDPALKGRTFNQADVVTTTITCANGEVITMRLDTGLPRFYDREFTVRGTHGFAMQTANIALIEGEQNLEAFWEPVEAIETYKNSADKFKEYLPDCWRNITPEEMALGHGGMDYIELKAFLHAVQNGEEMPVDVYDAATWMCITPLSEQSIAHGGMPQAIPDFTRGKWVRRPQKDVMPLPNIK